MDTTRLAPLTKTGILIRPLGTRKPGSLVLAEGMRVERYTNQLLKILFQQGSSWTPPRLRFLYLIVARVLATFDILPPADEDGCPRVPEARHNKALLR